MHKPTDAAIRLRLLVRRFAPFLRAAHQTAVNAKASFAAWRVRRIVERTFEARENVFFVQIGSNDGSRGDPLYAAVRRHGHWRGILVEPVPFVFERLKNNYDNDPRLIFENVAIAEGAKTLPFYYVSENAKLPFGGELPEWYDQLGSFNPAHIVKHLGDWIAPFVVSAPVQCSTLPDLLAKHKISHIDLLHIDAEGYDATILNQFALSRFAPRLIMFEHKHLEPAEKAEIRNRLAKVGYRQKQIGDNTVARRR
jgi:FkbM family methyltransferase